MTKLELIREIEENYKNSESVELSLTAVDRYSLALLQQTQCTALRERLGRRLSRETADKEYAIKAGNKVQENRADIRILLLQEMIDACPPVA